jgi:virginiamycin B lyase
VRKIKKLISYAYLGGALTGLITAGAQAQNAPALTGQVTSAEEGPMEGVLVSAKKDGTTITISVVSDQKGEYSFPADRLDAGHYTIAIRAGGYNLDGSKAVDIAGGGAKADIKLVKTKNLVNQLTNAEWLLSAPGPENVKTQLINCVECHTVHLCLDP